MSAVRSPDADPSRTNLRERAAALTDDLTRAARRPGPPAPAPEASTVFARIAASTREAAADALADDRVSHELRAAIGMHRDATLAMLLSPDDSNEASEPLCEAVEASGAALRAVPARSLADVRAKLAFLLPEILPDVNGTTPTAFLENVFDDVDRLAGVSAVLPDLTSLTIRHLARLHETAAHLWHSAGMFLNAPFAWDDRRENIGLVGRIIEREVDRLEELASAVAREARQRTPQGDDERDERFGILVRHGILGGGPLDDRDLIAEIAQAWSR